MDQTTWNIQGIAWMKINFQRRWPWIILQRLAALARKWQRNRCTVKPPALGAVQLEYEHIMCIEVRFESLGMWRGQVDIGLKWRAEFQLERCA